MLMSQICLDVEDRYPPPLQRISHLLKVWSWRQVHYCQSVIAKYGDFIGAIHTILTIQLGYRSICGKWAPHELSENQRLARLNIAKNLLETYENCDSRHLTEIITGDETWEYSSTPYSNYKKRSWVRDDEQPAKIPSLTTENLRLCMPSSSVVIELSCNYLVKVARLLLLLSLQSKCFQI
ncbi:Histone-lysine N-methyltransferase SETMAR-like [Oopsacas minuta]|uniref:Histone-lysine N-methyltransferase SETMAR-like n=1 Tax=Oopsacas minuta TaxID=111878 RepID=A0AAV7JM62_9METZ|nr:Histone-lysine N-methyltransferase SETMAR-like [Oopsacas minuta]